MPLLAALALLAAALAFGPGLKRKLRTLTPQARRSLLWQAAGFGFALMLILRGEAALAPLPAALAMAERLYRLSTLAERLKALLGKTSPGQAAPGTDMTEAEALVLLNFPPEGSPDATEIRAAFRAAMKSRHPDAGGSDAAAAKTAEARDLLLKLASSREKKRRTP